MKLKIVFAASLLVCTLSGCLGTGSLPAGASVSANILGNGSCTGMNQGQVCVIQVNYNTAGMSGVSLTYQPVGTVAGLLSQPINSQVYNAFQQGCTDQAMSATESGSCTMTIYYQLGSCITPGTITFSLTAPSSSSSITSNAITISGN